MIRVADISKSYKKAEALKNVSFDVNEGEIFGLIGPDGAGKTTLFRILTTLLIPDSGNASIFGYDTITDYKEIRKITGYMPGKFSLYQDLTVEENLNFFATVFGTTVKENYYLIKDIYSQIEPFKKRFAGKLSGGMKQKLALSCALIHKPKLLILDEPTTGVDAVSRKEFWEMLKRLKESGITILVSTSYMDEAILCDRIALIQKGRILSINTPSEITKQFPKKILAIRSDKMFSIISDLKEYNETGNIYLFGHNIHYTEETNNPDAGKIKDFLNIKNHGQIEVSEIEPTVEDCFIELMGGKE